MRNKQLRSKLTPLRDGKQASVSKPASADKSVFARIRDLRSHLSIGKGESARGLIDAGRRI